MKIATLIGETTTGKWVMITDPNVSEYDAKRKLKAIKDAGGKLATEKGKEVSFKQAYVLTKYGCIAKALSFVESAPITD